MQTDWAFCQHSLRNVSRTFSRPIELLEGDLQKAITCGYLLCRVADTVEDNTELTLAQRDSRYQKLLDVLDGRAQPSEFELMWYVINGSPESELALVRELHRVLAVLHALPASYQEVVIHWVSEMTRGMQIYSHRTPGTDGLVALSTGEDLERDCYFVAGTVGHMLTELFLQVIGLEDDHATAIAMQRNAESFGMGLQLVNILKDITDDRDRGWSFVPRAICRDYGLGVEQLVDPSFRQAAHQVMTPLFELARARLDRALEYALAVPPENPSIRMFCLLPLWMAVKTLVHAASNDSMFVSGEPVKISRNEVEHIITTCTQHCRDDELLRAEYQAMWRGLRLQNLSAKVRSEPAALEGRVSCL